MKSKRHVIVFGLNRSEIINYRDQCLVLKSAWSELEDRPVRRGQDASEGGGVENARVEKREPVETCGGNLIMSSFFRENG